MIAAYELCAPQAIAQETYTNFYEPQLPPGFVSPKEDEGEPPTYAELTARLQALEGKASTTEQELKKLSEPKPAEKPKG